jgi:adenine-specific DNA-methyltransferase
MAKIEDLIAQIPDERLKKAVGAEVRELKKNKKFGLVFEEHLPETVRLPKLPVKEGELVASKRDSGNDLWRVKTIRKGIASLERAVEGYALLSETGIEVPVAELVVVRNFGDPIYPALVPVDRVARGGPDKPWHMLINADNFHALQLLLYAYEGKVDVIYIDPPYNTGARDWKYNNDYVDKTDSFRHSKWLSMMKKRLLLAKRLLRTDGILIATVDDNELPHLWMLLKHLFPERNVTSVTIQHNPGGTQGDQFSVTHEYALFVMDAGAQVFRRDHIGGDTYNLRRWGSTSNRFEAATCFYPIYVKNGQIVGLGDVPDDNFSPSRQVIEKADGVKEVWPIDKNNVEKKWRYARNTIESVLDRTFVIDGPDRIEIKLRRASEQPKTVWTDKRYNAEAYGTDLVNQIVGKSFPYPKSVYAEFDCLLAAIRGKRNALVLDFFAGSGTTLHATALLNAFDSGTRRCILVTNNEVPLVNATDLMAKHVSPGSEEWEQNGICETITWPRSKFAIEGKRNDETTLEGTCLTGRNVPRSESRRVIQIGFAERGSMASMAKRKQLVALIEGIPQSAVRNESPFVVIPDGSATILFDVSAVDQWLDALAEAENVTRLYVVELERSKFEAVRDKVELVLGEYTTLAAEERQLSRGLEENLEYFRLDFLDPDEVARGDAFKAIVPILWMVAGCRGEREESKGSTPWFIPKHSPFAVLIQEKQFRAFREKLAERKDIEWVFLITDSEETFGQMRRTLGRKYECVQLYKSYLENFRINTQDALNG